MGIACPRTPRGGLSALLLRRLQVRLRGLEFRECSADEIPAADLARIDACWSVAVGLSMVDNIRGAYLQSRHLLLALDHGEPFRVLRAFAAEAAYLASRGRSAQRESEKLLSLAKRLAPRAGDSYAMGFITLSSGICSFLRGDFKVSLESCDVAEWTFERRPKGALWELASARSFGLWSRFYLGQYGALSERVPALLKEAEGRGDRYAATCQRTGLLNLAWLVEDDSVEARRNVLQAEREWSRSSFQFQHYLSALALSHIDLYEGNGAAAYDRMVALWPHLGASLYLRIQNLRLEALFLRARGALAAATVNPLRRDALADARRCAQKILREKSGWADPLAELVLAGVESAAHRPESALDHLRAAGRLAELAGMTMFKAAASMREGEVLGGGEGRALMAGAEGSMLAERVKNAPRMVAMLAPGFETTTGLGRRRFVLPPRR
jgi:eukaryotic-like serine/threonine-protein kinase